MTKRENLLNLVRKHPGLDAFALSELGWSHQKSGAFRQAEQDGAIEWRGTGWHVVEKVK